MIRPEGPRQREVRAVFRKIVLVRELKAIARLIRAVPFAILSQSGKIRLGQQATSAAGEAKRQQDRVPRRAIDKQK
ncbi:MAG: hypothetical protein HY852_19820 [Bradyrhizobium sp.]|uniref:hypothetical protein n=1 Tax=Bradyrhizobium sp. TaxID=376 RepID=UPI0025C3785B|nr:hypothetical protein [Bradyrhizobium sp.]MBI5264056.1 hypothetical protein [Bradyrhizobium sp.]